jgi:hypothetical protein
MTNEPGVHYEIKVSDLYNRCWEGTRRPENEKDKLKHKLKWLICFRLLFTLDMIHDFCSTIKNPEEEPTQSFGARNPSGTGPDDMYKSIVTENKVWCFNLLHNNYNDFEPKNDQNIENDKLFYSCVTEIFDPSSNPTILPTIDDPIKNYNCEYEILNDYFEPFNQDTLNIPILNENSTRTNAECVYRMMNMRMLSINKYKKYNYNGDDFRSNPTELLKMLTNGTGEIKDTYVFVDALQSMSALGPLNDYHRDLINGKYTGKSLYTYKTPADIADGANNNSITKFIERNKRENIKEYYPEKFTYTIINDLVPPKDSGTLISCTFTKFTLNARKFSYRVQVHNFFGITAGLAGSIENRAKSGRLTSTECLIGYKPITKKGLKEYVIKELGLYHSPNFDNDEYTVGTFALKTCMDLSKAIFMKYIKENVKSTPDINESISYFISTDTIGGFISSLFVQPLVSAVGGDIYNYEFINLLIPCQSGNIYDCKGRTSEQEDHNSAQRQEVTSDQPSPKRQRPQFGKKRPPTLKSLIADIRYLKLK